MDEELLQYVQFILWHRRTCGARRPCKTCDSANGIRGMIMAQIFSTVVYDEQKIAYKRGKRRR
jgi:hypothetical protein